MLPQTCNDGRDHVDPGFCFNADAPLCVRVLDNVKMPQFGVTHEPDQVGTQILWTDVKRVQIEEHSWVQQLAGSLCRVDQGEGAQFGGAVVAETVQEIQGFRTFQKQVYQLYMAETFEVVDEILTIVGANPARQTV